MCEKTEKRIPYREDAVGHQPSQVYSIRKLYLIAADKLRGLTGAAVTLPGPSDILFASCETMEQDVLPLLEKLAAVAFTSDEIVLDIERDREAETLNLIITGNKERAACKHAVRYYRYMTEQLVADRMTDEKIGEVVDRLFSFVKDENLI